LKTHPFQFSRLLRLWSNSAFLAMILLFVLRHCSIDHGLGLHGLGNSAYGQRRMFSDDFGLFESVHSIVGPFWRMKIPG
jgi:hypothetical protein